jgi:heme/copper-type cytochrome/quinol oxidase subunit 2
MSPTIASAIFWIAAACCAVAQIALIASAVRSPMPGSAESAKVAMPRRSREIAWTIVPAIALTILLVFTWRAMQPAPMSPDMPMDHRMIEE